MSEYVFGVSLALMSMVYGVCATLLTEGGESEPMLVMFRLERTSMGCERGMLLLAPTPVFCNVKFLVTTTRRHDDGTIVSDGLR